MGRHIRPLASIPLAALLACAGASGPDRHAELDRLLRDYREMPGARALALAGDPDRVWVAGASGGHASAGEAVRGALAECGRRRLARRLQVPCMLYARGDEVVWPQR